MNIGYGWFIYFIWVSLYPKKNYDFQNDRIGLVRIFHRKALTEATYLRGW